MQKFQKKYSIKSARLENYDYSQNGMYFVTICTKDKEELFGEIIDAKMILNEAGRIAERFWQEIPKHFPFVSVDEFVVMPNHVHGILEIINDNPVETPFMASSGIADMYDQNLITQDAINRVSTKGGFAGGKNPMTNPYSLSKIIRWYKGRCAFEIRNFSYSITFAWQTRFYDHIIRDDESLDKIREYIVKNPEMWEQEEDNVENVFT